MTRHRIYHITFFSYISLFNLTLNLNPEGVDWEKILHSPLICCPKSNDKFSNGYTMIENLFILGYFQLLFFFLCNIPFPDSLFSPQDDAEHNGSPHDGQLHTEFSFIGRRHSRQTGAVS